MAARLSLPEDELSCPVCCDIFRDPVVLRCSHSFCKACLGQYWRQRGSGRDCPLCRSVSSTEEEPVVSLTLKNLCDSYIQEAAAEPEWGERCPQHGEPLKLFCLEDKQPICVVCHTSRKHKDHKCCPLEEAILDYKEELKAALKTLQEKREALEGAKQSFEKTAAHIKTQAQRAEKLIKEEFEKLHGFLRAEEVARLAALKEEDEEKSRAMKETIERVTRDVSSLSNTIRAVEEEMGLEGVTILHNYKTTWKRSQSTVQEPELVSGALIDVPAHVGCLSYRVWEKMQGIIQYTPVTLDPNTAAPCLILSEDLTSLYEGEERQPLPDNPERFDPDAGVLGAQGFRSGTHSWDVEVGDNVAWIVGVAKESVQRKERVSSVVQNGYLAIFFYENMYIAGTSPLTRLSLKRQPHRIRVRLECDRGQLSFTDLNNNAHIYTFKHKLTEKVFPYLWLGSRQSALRILPGEVSVWPSTLS